MGVVFLAVLIWSIRHFVINVKKLKYKVAIPMTINLITLLVVIFTPFTDIMLNLDFKLNLKDREKVVSMVQSGELKPNVSYNESLIELLDKYKHLSQGGGEIIVHKDGERFKIFFYTFRGVIDNFSGFAYISDESRLLKTDFEGDFEQIKKEKEHWFWGASR